MVTKAVISSVNVEARKNLGIRAGDTVRVMQKIQEKGKIRLQAFEGLVLAVKHGTEAGATFTVRKVASGVGVEKILPLYSPMIDQIEIVKRTKVRRAKLYYIREKAAKVIRRSMRNAYAVGDTIESDIGEKERVAREADEAKAAEAKAAEEAAAKAAEEEAAKKAEEEANAANEAVVETPAEVVKEEAAPEAAPAEAPNEEEKKD
jgi:large subunit ribosomal protein L19